MLYVNWLILSIGLKVKLPMILEMDNKIAISVDLVNNWSVGSRTRYMDVQNHFLRVLKGKGLRYAPGAENVHRKFLQRM